MHFNQMELNDSVARTQPRTQCIGMYLHVEECRDNITYKIRPPNTYTQTD
jgi:hypothetical protein